MIMKYKKNTQKLVNGFSKKSKIVSRSIFQLGMVLNIILFNACESNVQITQIDGFTSSANQQLKDFLIMSRNEKGRKIAVFDGDGTVLGQTPHYLADECMYQWAEKRPDHRPLVINSLKTQSNVSLSYVQNRIRLVSGMSLQEYRDLGEDCFDNYYTEKIFRPMEDLIHILKSEDFEVWIVTASPEGMYQQFLSKVFQIPITRIIGVKSVVRDGIITDEIVHPVPQDHGKKEAIETFVQDVPLLVAGNSRGDKEMIEYSKGLKLIVNPDEHIAPDQKESIADYAKRNNWLVLRVNDIPDLNFPSVSSIKYGKRLNKTRDYTQPN
jgi:phosphoserine phosphatase